MQSEVYVRFWQKVAVTDPDGCWLWTAATSKAGYGRFWLGENHAAHRVAYEMLVGVIPPDLHIDHLCRTRNCVNPFHMEPVPREENTRRGLAGMNNWVKTHCPKGHPYSGANLYVPPAGDRQCRECKRQDDRRRRRR